MCFQYIDSGTDWPQVVVTGIGVLIAALVAIWVGSRQNRAQVLHQARQDVASFLETADLLNNQLGGLWEPQELDGQPDDQGEIYEDRPLPEAVEETFREMKSKADLIRLTAPDNIYLATAEIQWNFEAMRGEIVHGIRGIIGDKENGKSVFGVACEKVKYPTLRFCRAP